ncbi:hypothetical protein CPB84DRAFT_1447038 [Gymnopilus junonius]|uniref:Transmembrane protein n=1 Tax=Gymnopilus junonius TaxID=109634 RepID=A0A9P5TKM2_GYMJU|nr:hypothetical protein CPB84DRAFT_1447038 [Gymnopilus junonius]
MAPVSIPSNLSLEEIWHSQPYTGYLALNAAVVFGVVLWDYLQLLPEERSLYEMRRRREWHSPAPWAFVALRYSALASTLCGLIYSSLRLSLAKRCLSRARSLGNRLRCSWGYTLFSSGFPVGLSASPACHGLHSLYYNDCVWMAFAAQFRVTTGVALPFGTNCQFVPLEIWTPVSYATTAAFHIIVLGLVITRVFTKATVVAMNTGLTLINRACILYLICATLPCIAIACVYSISWHTELLKRSGSSYLILIVMSMSSRVFLNLQLHHQILTRVAESNHFTSPTWTPPSPNPEKVISNPKPRPDEPEFEPVLTMLSVPESDVLSIDRYTTRTTLTAPETPVTLTSFSGSTIYSGSSYGNVISPSRSRQGSQRSHIRAGSVKSSSSGSTRVTYATPRSPPRSERVESLRSLETTSTRHTDTTPKSPRNGSLRVGSVRSVGTSSTRLTGHRSNKRVRMASLNSFATTSKLPTENLKSTWHGV